MDTIAERADAQNASTRDELKLDNAKLHSELKGDIGALQDRLTTTNRQLNELRKELKDDIGELRSEFKHEIAGLRDGQTTTNRELSELRASVARLEGPLHPGLIRPS